MPSPLDIYSREDPGSLSPRETKKRRTKADIENHATRLVLALGMHNVTVEDISNAAGISPRTFFNYFSTKEEAVMGQGPSSPSHADTAAFLTIQSTDESLLIKATELLVHLITKDNTCDVEILKRREHIKQREPELHASMFNAFHQRQHRANELMARYLELHPEKARTTLAPEQEAQYVTSLCFMAIGLAIPVWESLPGEKTASQLLSCVRTSVDSIQALTRN